MIWDHVCVSVEDEEAASCNLHDFGYVASTAVSPIRQLGLGERETIFRLLYERVMPWPSDNTHAPTSIHAMRRIRTALTHTHGAGGTAFTKKKKASRNGRLLGVGPTPRQRERMSASHSHGGARHRTAAGRGGRRARGEVFTAPTQHRPAGQVKYPSPGVRWAVARGRSRHARSAHGGAAGRGSHFQRSGFAAAATVVFRSSVCESVTRSVYLGPASVLEQSSKLVVCFRSGTVK